MTKICTKLNFQEIPNHGVAGSEPSIDDALWPGTCLPASSAPFLPFGLDDSAAQRTCVRATLYVTSIIFLKVRINQNVGFLQFPFGTNTLFY